MDTYIFYFPIVPYIVKPMKTNRYSTLFNINMENAYNY